MSQVLREQAFQILECASSSIHQGDVAEGVDQLMKRLNDIRMHEVANMGEVLSRADILDHPLSKLIHQDPLTHHAFSRPRGYPGDAELLDHIYRVVEPNGISNVARGVNEYCLDTGACQSVRARREILASTIDAVADSVPMPRIVSIACGHLREASLSRAIGEDRIGELIAVDQDEESLGEVRRSITASALRVCKASVLQIIAGRVTFSDADLVYAAGLYDYLALPVARRLTLRMFEMLRPGGRLLVANFAPNLGEIGYMETFMDWHLIYRDEAQLAEVAADIDQTLIAGTRIFRDEPGNLVFLEIVRA